MSLAFVQIRGLHRPPDRLTADRLTPPPAGAVAAALRLSLLTIPVLPATQFVINFTS